MQSEKALFDAIASDLRNTGYSIQAHALSPGISSRLRQEAQAAQAGRTLKAAGIGRHTGFTSNAAIRRDEIAWIEGETEIQKQWLNWCSHLQLHMNRQLMLGLFSFESHYAHYAPGAFYKKHVDAFKGQANRMLSVVAYLNPNWNTENGGELVIYSEHQANQEVVRVSPQEGTVVVFLSEEFPHEVLPAKVDRYSIAGWYRLNTSTGQRVDPPT